MNKIKFIKKEKTHPNWIRLSWCRWWDSNPHGFLHTILSRGRLPFRHTGEYSNIIHDIKGNYKPIFASFANMFSDFYG